MIKKINIRSVASFNEEGAMIEDLGKINYIFGENGAGKTTISNFLYDINDQKYNMSEIEFEKGNQEQIYVYNNKFVLENFREQKIPGIFTLGAKASLQSDKLEKLEQDKISSHDNLAKLKKSLQKNEDELAKIEDEFKNLAWKTIYKNNHIKFKNTFKGFNTKKAFLDRLLISQEDSFDGNRVDLEKKAEKIFNLELKKYNSYDEIKYSDVLSIENNDIWLKTITGKENIPISKLISTLNNSDWVHTGKEYINNTSICPFCQKNTIDEEFRKQLEHFFDDEYNSNIELIKKLISTYSEEIENIKAVLNYNKENFYINDEEQNDHDFVNKMINLEKRLLLQLRFNLAEMNKKLMSPSYSTSFTLSKSIIDEINNIIKLKNNKIAENNSIFFDRDVVEKILNINIWQLLYHENSDFINVYIEKINNINKAIKSLKDKILTNNQQLDGLIAEINSLNSQLSNTTATVRSINKLLIKFGFINFKLECVDENFYQINRLDGKNVGNTLSEGERNFVTFLYFYHLINGGFNTNVLQENKIVVIDDPICSLDSNVIFIVSTLINNLRSRVLEKSSKINQLIVLTHNVYFYKEISFKKNEQSDKDKYWIISKTEGVSGIKYYSKNPISSSYQLLWAEYKLGKKSNSVSVLQNLMRRIIETYFLLIGGINYDKIIEKFKSQDDKIIVRSLISFINDGSHNVFDDFYITDSTYAREKYFEVFESIFKITGHEGHYDMMMQNAENL